MGELKKSFETKWSNFDQRIDDLEGSVYGAVYKSANEVKQFLEVPFRRQFFVRARATAVVDQLTRETLDAGEEDYFT